MIIDYDKLKNEIISILEHEQSIVLATSVDGKVTARTMSHVNDEPSVTVLDLSEMGSE